jgi:hypothetical protein
MHRIVMQRVCARASHECKCVPHQRFPMHVLLESVNGHISMRMHSSSSNLWYFWGNMACVRVWVCLRVHFYRGPERFASLPVVEPTTDHTPPSRDPQRKNGR